MQEIENAQIQNQKIQDVTIKMPNNLYSYSRRIENTETFIICFFFVICVFCTYVYFSDRESMIIDIYVLSIILLAFTLLVILHVLFWRSDMFFYTVCSIFFTLIFSTIFYEIFSHLNNKEKYVCI